MTLTSWTTKRILMLWVGGLVLQALLILTPAILARHLVANSAALLRNAAEQDARWRVGDRADSLSLAKQRTEARTAGAYSVTARGDTLFPLVHVPSGRPDSASMAAYGQKVRRTARYVTAALFGLIPTLLVLVTGIWLVLRRQNDAPSQAFGAP